MVRPKRKSWSGSGPGEELAGAPPGCVGTGEFSTRWTPNARRFRLRGRSGFGVDRVGAGLATRRSRRASEAVDRRAPDGEVRAMNVLVDLNVLLDVFLNRAPWLADFRGRARGESRRSDHRPRIGDRGEAGTETSPPTPPRAGRRARGIVRSSALAGLRPRTA